MIEDEPSRGKFEALYLRCKDSMFYTAHRILQNEVDAEDAVHEAFVSILTNLEKISDVESPKTRAYCVIITERKAIDLIRSRKKTAALEDNEPGLEISVPGGGALAAAMAKLPPRYREVLLLRYYVGYHTKELADILDLKKYAVEKLLWRAKARLKELLERGRAEVSEKDIFSDRELSEAAEAVCGAMLDTLPPVEQGGRRFSPAFEQNMERLIADGQRRLQWRRTLIRAAQLAACLALAAALTLAAVPEARAWSADFLKGIQEWFTDHVTYRFDGAATAELGRWRPNHAPEG